LRAGEKTVLRKKKKPIAGNTTRPGRDGSDILPVAAENPNTALIKPIPYKTK